MFAVTKITYGQQKALSTGGKCLSFKFPEFGNTPEDGQRVMGISDKALGFEGKKGKTLYDDLDDIRQAGLLNIAAKTWVIALTNGQTVLSYVHELRELRGDRFVASVPKGTT